MAISGFRKAIAGLRLSLNRSDLNMLHYSVLRGNSDIQEKWERLTHSEKVKYITDHIRLLRRELMGDKSYLYKLLSMSSPDVQSDIIELLSDGLSIENAREIAPLLSGISLKSLEKVTDIDTLRELSVNSLDPKKKLSDSEKEIYNNITERVMESFERFNAGERFNSLLEFWNKLPDDIKNNNSTFFDRLRETAVKLKSEDILEVWKSGTADIQLDNSTFFNNLINNEKTSVDLARLWEYSKKEFQEEKFDEFFDRVKGNPDLVADSWAKTNGALVALKRDDLIEKLEREPISLIRALYADSVALKNIDIRNKYVDQLKEIKPTKKFAEFLGCSKEDISHRIDRLIEFTKDNPELVTKQEPRIDLGILDERLVRSIAGDGASKDDQIKRVKLLTKNNPDLSNNIVKLSKGRDADIRMRIFEKITEDSRASGKEEEWMRKAEKLTESMPKYRKLLREFDKSAVGPKDIERLNDLLSMSDQKFKINNLTQLKSLDAYMKEKADKDIKSLNLDKRKNAVLMRKFGISLKEAQDMLVGIDLRSLEMLDKESSARLLYTALREITGEKSHGALSDIYSAGGRTDFDRKATLDIREQLKKEIKEKRDEIRSDSIRNATSKDILDEAKVHIRDEKTGSDMDISYRKGGTEFSIVAVDSKERLGGKDKFKYEVLNPEAVGKADSSKLEDLTKKEFLGYEGVDDKRDHIGRYEKRPSYVVIVRDPHMSDEEFNRRLKKVSETEWIVPMIDKKGKVRTERGKVKTERSKLPVVVLDADECRNSVEKNSKTKPKTNLQMLEESYKATKSSSPALIRDTMKKIIDINKDRRTRLQRVRDAAVKGIQNIQEFLDRD